PALVILDLDQTLWPFDAALPRFGLPHRRGPDGVHCQGAPANPFSEAVEIVRQLKLQSTEECPWRLAVASANSQDKVCTSLLNHLGLLKERDSYGGIDPKLLVIHPGSKTVHFNEIAQRTGIEFREMLFFDDRAMNVRVAQKLGISAYQVSSLEGLTYKAFAAGLQTWRSERRSSSALSSWLQPQPKNLPRA
ncbi:MDP1, partial [Symbiodinium microadriaticum]